MRLRVDIIQPEVHGDLISDLHPKSVKVHSEQNIQNEFLVILQWNLRKAELQQYQNGVC